MGDAITSPPLAGPMPRMIPKDPLPLCQNLFVVLHTIVTSDLDSISMCKLHHFIVDLSETPRYFWPWYGDTPT